MRSLGITTQTLVYKGGLETTNYRSKIYLNFALNFSKIIVKILFIFNQFSLCLSFSWLMFIFPIKYDILFIMTWDAKENPLAMVLKFIVVISPLVSFAIKVFFWQKQVYG